MRFLQMHSFYDNYLDRFYRSHQGLQDAPFQSQMEELLRDGFSDGHIIAPHLGRLGYEAKTVVVNNRRAQEMWAGENGIPASAGPEREFEIARRQVESFRPDVLYISHPIGYDDRFTASLAHSPAVILGWRAAPIPEGTSWRSFDALLSSNTPCLEAAKRIGARSSIYYHPGFSRRIADICRSIKPEWDVAFSGQWSDLHAMRNRYLLEAAKAPLQKKRPFTLAFFLPNDPRTLPAGIAMNLQPAMWGLDMFRCLRRGRITLNAGIDMADNEAPNMRLFEATGVGAFLLTELQRKIENFFVPGKEIATFTSPEDLVEKIHYYLDHPSEREEIARRGQERCLRDYSMENRAEVFDSIVQKLLAKKTVRPRRSTEKAATLGGTLVPAVEALNSGESDRALGLFRQALRIRPDLHAIHYGEAVALARSGQLPEASGRLDDLLRVQPGNEKARLLRGEISRTRPVPVEQNPPQTAPRPELSSMDSARTTALKETVANLMRRAMSALQANGTDEAFQWLIRAKSLRQPLQGLDHLRAVCFLRMNRLDDARESLREELRYFPGNSGASELLQQILAQSPEAPPPDTGDPEFQSILTVVRPYTMLSVERLYSLFRLAKHACERDIPGNFVECGVAAGGASAVLACVLKRYSRRPRRLYSFDSFEGMPEPTEHDRHEGLTAQTTGWGTGTCAATEASVREVCAKLGAGDLVTTVRGYFCDTLPVKREEIGPIAMLHLDADWYESTRDILVNLYDRVVEGGLLQVDDYGHWEGCRKAVHEFESQRGLSFDIHRIDPSGVWLIKENRGGFQGRNKA